MTYRDQYGTIGNVNRLMVVGTGPWRLARRWDVSQEDWEEASTQDGPQTTAYLEMRSGGIRWLGSHLANVEILPDSEGKLG